MEKVFAWTFQRERWIAFNLLIVLSLMLICAGAFSKRTDRYPVWETIHNPIRPVGVNADHVRADLKNRLVLASQNNGQGELRVCESPMGALKPTGEVNADGSEVWSYPEGSVLAGWVEVHVKDGRVVREVLRPSARSTEETVVGALSEGGSARSSSGSP
jgi:hypothetical protein